MALVLSNESLRHAVDYCMTDGLFYAVVVTEERKKWLSKLTDALLSREVCNTIRRVLCSYDQCGVLFKNGSMIEFVPPCAQFEGRKYDLLIVDDVIGIDSTIVKEVFLPREKRYICDIPSN